MSTAARAWEPPRCLSTDKQTKIMWHEHAMEYWLSHEKEWNNATCSNVNGPGDYHTKQSESEGERQIPDDIASMWNVKYNTHQIQSSWPVAAERGGWTEEGKNGSLGLLNANCIRWINNKVLCIAQGTIFDILWQTIMEKNVEKYMWASLVAQW